MAGFFLYLVGIGILGTIADLREKYYYKNK